MQTSHGFLLGVCSPVAGCPRVLNICPQGAPNPPRGRRCMVSPTSFYFFFFLVLLSSTCCPGFCALASLSTLLSSCTAPRLPAPPWHTCRDHQPPAAPLHLLLSTCSQKPEKEEERPQTQGLIVLTRTGFSFSEKGLCGIGGYSMRVYHRSFNLKGKQFKISLTAS